jgi:hypothetical protein
MLRETETAAQALSSAATSIIAALCRAQAVRYLAQPMASANSRHKRPCCGGFLVNHRLTIPWGNQIRWLKIRRLVVPTPSYQPSVMEFDELSKKPADLSWNIFCLVFGLVTVAVFGFALSCDLGYHPMAVIENTQTVTAIRASLSGPTEVQGCSGVASTILGPTARSKE